MLYKPYTDQELDEARQLLRQMGVKSLIGRNYASLSQGEKQVLLIARSLILKPELLILDEATNGLDLFAKEKLLKQLQQINQLKTAPTLIYISHHPDEITDIFTHLLLLREGKVIQSGKKENLLNEMEPFLSGGDMIEYVYEDHTTFLDAPQRFEAGTANV